MSDMLTVVTDFLRRAQFELSELSQGAFVFVAQNPYTLIFGVQVKSDLIMATHDVILRLTGPFRANIFGPRTMEMYALFLCPESTTAEQIMECERDTRVCRKIAISRVEDVEPRLLFLRPVETVEVTTIEPDELFWNELSHLLSAQELDFLGAVEQGSADVKSEI